MTLRLTILRERLGLSKAKLSRLADLDQSLISKIEKGFITPYEKQLSRLADALGQPRDKAPLMLEHVESDEN